MRSVLLLFAALALFGCQNETQPAVNFSDPANVLIGDKKIPKVLLVGSWHFSYPGQDAHVTDEDERVNIFTDKRQQELQDLLDYLMLFQPTKIAVESGRNTGYLLHRYKGWQNGEMNLQASERDQVGIRLMHQAHLDTLYGVDAYPLILELNDNRDSTQALGYVDEILERHYFGGEDDISKRYSEIYKKADAFTLEHTLLESFKYFNSDQYLRLMNGSYIAGGQFDSENYEGVDALSMFWMNRNMRIFRNIQRLDYTEDDRILVLFGSGHIPIIKFLFESSPEFELVKFNDLNRLTK